MRPVIPPKKITSGGQTNTIAVWSKKLGVSPQVINGRIRKGWSIEKALSEPLKKLLTTQEKKTHRYESVKKYYATDKGKASRTKTYRKYQESAHGEAKKAEYRKSEKRRDVQHKFNTSEKGRKLALVYARTDKGKMTRKKFVTSTHGRAYRLWNSARLRSIKNGILFTLTRERVQKAIEKGLCEVTGIPFSESGGARGPYTSSLDRIVPSLGYTDENTQVVVWIYNAAKGDWGHSDVMRLVRVLSEGISEENNNVYVSEGSLS